VAGHAVFLELNGVGATHASNDDGYDFVMDVAAGQRSVTEIARRLRRIVKQQAEPGGAVVASVAEELAEGAEASVA
jgi:prophage maintenance system killer protein